MSSNSRRIIQIISLFTLVILACSAVSPNKQGGGGNTATQIPQNIPVDAPASAPSEVPASTATITNAVPPLPTFTVEPLDLTCTWLYEESPAAIATGGGTPGMTAEREGTWIGTRFMHGGNFGCEDQEFVTAHEWDGLREELIPGKLYHLTVTLTWRLEGTAECSSLTAGAKTSISVGDFKIEAGQSTIVLSSQPDGDLIKGGDWIAPKGAEDGDELKISVHGSSGSLGGTVTYKYKYFCKGD